MKTVTVYSTRDARDSQFETSASTWRELQTNLDARGFTYSNMKVVIGGSNLILEHPDAVLPEEDFILYLIPVKNKSGADVPSSYWDCRNMIKAIIIKNPEAKAHFDQGNKSYTNKSTADMQKLLLSWFNDDNRKPIISPTEVKPAAIKPDFKAEAAKIARGLKNVNL